MDEAKKYAQIKKEAAYTGAALGLLIVFWLLAGFGMANIPLKLGGIPLWVWTSTIGVWLAAIGLSCWLAKGVFRDMDLTDGGKEALHD